MDTIPGCTKVWSVGAEHPDRELFDCLMPLPFGTTYNSYLLRGEEKIALIDPVDPAKADVLMEHLHQADIPRLDYIVCLHTEQDHSGAVHTLLKEWPDARVVGTAKVRDLMMTHVHLDEAAMDVVTEEDVLDLGGLTLRFYAIPFAHWPDNTMAYCPEEDILFSSDLFGAHYAVADAAEQSDDVRMSAARSYYSEIMMPFAAQISRHTARVKELNPGQIAPSHGPVWQKPKRILDAYETWSSNTVCRKVTIPYLSMHDSTEVLVKRLTATLRARGVDVSLHNIGRAPESLVIGTGHMIYDLVDCAAMILGTPTVLAGPHPAAVYAAVTAAAMRPGIRLFGLVGSFGWGCRTAETIEALTSSLKAERLESLLIKGMPNEEDLAAIDAYANKLADRLDELGIV